MSGAVMRGMAITITVIMTTAITSMAAITHTMVTIMLTTITIMTSMTTITITVTAMLMTTGTDRDTHEPVADTDESAALFRLMTWLSPSFPVGAFSYSSGIEWAVEAGDITDTVTLQDWLAAMLLDGAGFCDGTLLCHAYRAAAAVDGKALNDVAELAAAFVPSRERHL